MEEEEHKYPPQILQKVEEFNSKIEKLESSLQKKDQEIVILKYAYENLLATLNLLENKKIYKNLPEAPRTYFPPKDPQLVSTVLKKVGFSRLFDFLPLSSLINLRKVCKTWNSELSSVILIEKYKKSWLFNEETKKKVEEARNQANDEFVAAISAVQNNDLNEIKAIRMASAILNELFIAILFFFGENAEVKDKGNVFGEKFRDINSFMARVLQHNISKKMSASALAKVKNHITKFNLNYQDLNRVSRAGANLFRVLECKAKWEDFLNENLKDEAIFIADGAKEFFEKLGK